MIAKEFLEFDLDFGLALEGSPPVGQGDGERSSSGSLHHSNYTQGEEGDY
jgi:hypothetical protein